MVVLKNVYSQRLFLRLVFHTFRGSLGVRGTATRILFFLRPALHQDLVYEAAPVGLLLAGDWDGVARSSPVVQRTASGLVSAFAAWHIERGLRSLAHVER